MAQAIGFTGDLENGGDAPALCCQRQKVGISGVFPQYRVSLAARLQRVERFGPFIAETPFPDAGTGTGE